MTISFLSRGCLHLRRFNRPRIDELHDLAALFGRQALNLEATESYPQVL
jgi:hypothetical protein